MKKLVTLLVVFLLLAVSVPVMATDFTFSGWAHTENTYGNNDNHENALEARLTVNAKINEQLNFVYQFRTLGFYDNAGWKPTNSGDSVDTRLAYLAYNPFSNFNVVIGKNAYWLAGGLLMDDFIRGVSANYKINDNISLFGLVGRYEENLNEQIYAAAFNCNFSGVDLGLTYLGSTDTVQGEAKNLANATIKDYDGTRILALTGGYSFGKLNLSGGYAVNTAADELWKTGKDGNTAFKLQLGYSGIPKTGIYLQYFKQDEFMMWPTETGNHMGWWGDMYATPTGHSGVRLIGEYRISDNVGLTLAHGFYNFNDTAYNDKTVTKTTLELAVNF